MRTRLLLGLAPAFLLAFNVPAFGQFTGRQPRSITFHADAFRAIVSQPIFQVQDEKVQKELKLSDAQIRKVRDLRQKKFEKLRARMKKTAPGERVELSALQKELDDEANKSLKAVLSAEQMKRLNQIVLQTLGPSAFTEARVQNQLKLTDDQKAHVEAILTDRLQESLRTREKMRRKTNAFEMGRKLRAFDQDTTKQLVGILDDQQKKRWKEMIGKPFFQP